MKEDVLEMTAEDRKRLHIIRKAELREIKQRQAAELLEISVRQVRRIIRKVRKEGDGGVIHKLRGRNSNHALDRELREKSLEIYRQRYEGFGPTFASEKLAEEQQIRISEETLRNWLKQERISYPGRRPRPHRQWRDRRTSRGEMIQLDGSHHDWLEGRGPKLVLMAYIDDATSEVFARFYDSEDNFAVLDSFKRYVRKNGLPCSVYTDRHAVYKAERRPLDIDEQLAGQREPMTNFQRALKELGIQIIFAHSPQAKGRIERLFETLQDRLVKEMRLLQIRTQEQANIFLGKYLNTFNRKYSVVPANTVDLHRKLPPQMDINRILCVKENRVLKNDFTVQFGGRFYQIKDKIKANKIIAAVWLNGSLHFQFDDKDLHYEEIHPPQRALKPKIARSCRKPTKPPKDHPWRKLHHHSKEKHVNHPMSAQLR